MDNNIVIDGYTLSIILAVIIAGYKNRSLVGWFLASVFLSWIAVIIVVLLPHKYYRR